MLDKDKIKQLIDSSILLFAAFFYFFIAFCNSFLCIAAIDKMWFCNKNETQKEQDPKHRIHYCVTKIYTLTTTDKFLKTQTKLGRESRRITVRNIKVIACYLQKDNNPYWNSLPLDSFFIIPCGRRFRGCVRCCGWSCCCCCGNNT